MKTGAITIRSATPADWRAIASLLDEGGLPLQGAQEHLADFVVAATGRSVVGCAGLERHDVVALLRSVAVAPLMGRRGIGSALLGRILQDAKQRHVRQIFLLTTDMDGYFLRFGFVTVPRERASASLAVSAEFRGACPSSATLMARELPG